MRDAEEGDVGALGDSVHVERIYAQVTEAGEAGVDFGDFFAAFGA